MITDMKPDRELDALVAEKVIGCKVHQKKYASGYTGIGKTWPSCGCELGKHNIDDGPACGTLLDYSTDISAAWQVVEKLMESGYFVSLQNCHSPEYKWCCVLTKIEIESEPAEGMAQTAPHAICLAALKAVGG